MDIDYINKTANKTLQDMLSKDFKQYKLKDKESIIINNPSDFKKLENNKIDFDTTFGTPLLLVPIFLARGFLACTNFSLALFRVAMVCANSGI
mgnify:CR=1 FL=1